MPTGVYKRTPEMKTGKHMLGKTLSEATKSKISSFHKGNTYSLGKNQTEIHKQNISKALKGIKRSEEYKNKFRGNKNPFYGKKHSEESKRIISEANKGKKLPEKHKKMLADLASQRRGKLHPLFGTKGYWAGKKRSEETCKKFSVAQLKRFSNKENHPRWLGGLSLNPYPTEFNNKLKLNIRTRDNFTCCLCGKTEREELEDFNQVLCVNHIDFDKNNCKEENLNTLCVRCNAKINRERDYWTHYFQTSC
jgi:hypothetical protein